LTCDFWAKKLKKGYRGGWSRKADFSAALLTMRLWATPVEMTGFCDFEWTQTAEAKAKKG
jgi:hypothetical protein